MMDGSCVGQYTRECLVLRVARRLGSLEVIDPLVDVMRWRGIPHLFAPNLLQRLRLGDSVLSEQFVDFAELLAQDWHGVPRYRVLAKEVAERSLGQAVPFLCVN